MILESKVSKDCHIMIHDGPNSARSQKVQKSHNSFLISYDLCVSQSAMVEYSSANSSFFMHPRKNIRNLIVKTLVLTLQKTKGAIWQFAPDLPTKFAKNLIFSPLYFSIRPLLKHSMKKNMQPCVVVFRKYCCHGYWQPSAWAFSSLVSYRVPCPPQWAESKGLWSHLQIQCGELSAATRPPRPLVPRPLGRNTKRSRTDWPGPGWCGQP